MKRPGLQRLRASLPVETLSSLHSPFKFPVDSLDAVNALLHYHHAKAARLSNTGRDMPVSANSLHQPPRPSLAGLPPTPRYRAALHAAGPTEHWWPGVLQTGPGTASDPANT